MSSEPDALVAQQIEYYRRRAAEYDETASPPGDPLEVFTREIERALRAFAPTGDVLEVASGTGTWTRLLLECASSVTALDAAPEMHRESRRKLGDDPRLRYVEADVLSWEPDRCYDVVFFANWLSHVPPKLFDGFWDTLRRALSAEGRVFLVDESNDAPRHERLSETYVAEAEAVVRRPLRDGTTFDIVKVFWDPAELAERVRTLGWEMTVRAVGPFLYAQGAPVGKGSA
ncbi:MAG TPA: class I SAM-dependent methyltransferase [Actinomycetota bacterium]|nr:class I SAM-dependent methyltransferase [Actinomycetota bacterium]